MWTHKIGAVFRTQGQTQVEVAFINDADSTINFSTKYSIVSLDQLKQLIQSQLDACKNADDLYASLVPGGPLDIVADRITVDANEQLYFELLNKWNRVQLDIQNDLITADDPSVIQLQKDLKTAYKPEYSGL